ncbi:MAG TPA: hypothetical protein VGR01_06910 [Burkholderiales bacterium]|jgi:hypothetical protein|nr:hypothetical protein [Burkholderiales bacterium]
MVALANEPQSIGRVLDSGFKLFVKSFTGVIPLSLAAAAVLAVPNIANVVMGGAEQAQSPVPAATVLVLFLLALPIYMILIAAVVYRLGAAAGMHEASAGQALARGVRCVLTLIGAAILYLLAMAGGLILLIIPGIILSLSLSFGFFAIVLDGESALGGLKRSHRLVWGNWWRTLAVVSVPVVIVMILYLGLGIAFGATLVMSDGRPASDVLITANLIEAAIGGITAPLIYSIMIAQYHDLKLRKEGHDLAARLA